MSIVLFILALAAAFIGTIFAFRAISRIHSGETESPSRSRAVCGCVTLHRICADMVPLTWC